MVSLFPTLCPEGASAAPTLQSQQVGQQKRRQGEGLADMVSLQPSLADIGMKYASNKWKGRFNTFLTPVEATKVKESKAIGDPVFVMDGESLAKLCVAKYMDEILSGMGYSAETVNDLKARSSTGLNMTLVIFEDDDELPPATWEIVLGCAQQMLEKTFGERGHSSLPNLADPKWAMKLRTSTSPERKFNFGQPEDRNGVNIHPVNGELMNFNIALERGFTVDDDEKCVAQLRSLLLNELSCNTEFKGDGFTWKFDEASKAWSSSTGREYIIRNFDIHKADKPHHEILVDLAWKDNVRQVGAQAGLAKMALEEGPLAGLAHDQVVHLVEASEQIVELPNLVADAQDFLKEYSAHPDEEELLLAPGTTLRVQTSATPTDDLSQIHLVEEPPSPEPFCAILSRPFFCGF